MQDMSKESIDLETVPVPCLDHIRAKYLVLVTFRPVGVVKFQD